MTRAALFFLLLVPAMADDQSTLTFKLNGSHISLPPTPADAGVKKNAKGAAAPQVVRQVFQVVGGNQLMPIFSTINSAAAQSDLAPGDPPILRWKNGETLRGEIAAASPGDVTWKTPLFADPLQLRWDAVDRIDWPAVPVPPTGPFSIALRDGSFIYGDVVDVGAETLSIHSTRDGDAVLKRSEVLSVRRLRNGRNLTYCGPTGDVGWKALTNQQDGSVNTNSFGTEFAPALTTGPGGALWISSWNRSGRLDLTLPDSVEVDFSLSTLERPDFLLALGGNPRATLRIETWDDQLVVALGEDFQVIRKIGDDERRLALRVYWDKVAQRCLVVNAAGGLITEWHVPRSLSSTAPGLVLENKGLNLSLDYLCVRQWDGKPPPKIDLKQMQVELADGRCLTGTLVAGAPGGVHLQQAGQTAVVDVPMANLDALQFSGDPPQVPDHEATFLYNDGSILYGSLESVSNGRASVATYFTTKPLSSQLDALRQMVVRVPAPAGTPPEKPLANLDKIVVGQTTLHGLLGTAGNNSVGWVPVGGVKASRPSLSQPSAITRFFPLDAPASGDSALFYMTSGDVLPGNLGSLDRTGAEFNSSLMAARRIPAMELNAIKFGPTTQLKVDGFKDPGWQIVRGDETKVHRDDDGLRLDPGAAVGFASLMQSSEISFKFISNGLSAARLRMFTSKTDSARGINLLLGSTGNQFLSGLESTQGQFDNQVQIRTNPGDPVNVRLEIGEDQVELFVNDVSQLHIPIDPAKRAGSGLVIEPAGLWGNNSFSVSLAGFAAHTGPGRTWLPDVSDDVRNQVLTVPRFQKDDPPPHLLLAGNDDVLRGEITAATAEHFGFRCGLENLSVPRERVGAVIWLKPAEANPVAVAPPVDKPAASSLDQRIPGRIMFRQVGLTQLVSFLESQVPGLKITLPQTVEPRTVPMLFANQTVSEALDVICSRFDLHYHLDPDGTVVLDAATANPAADLAVKTYWLKPEAMPKTPTVQEILTAKGVTFGNGASVDWQPEGGLLSMANTPENQARLAALIDSDFGGSQGSPTHWLQLASGARLALAVDQIGPDFITGHHPVYGAVKVPMAQVYIIRTTPPPPSSAIRSLENWRLVNAPEPVLPEGSGVASPLLGKDAATFKLPLLAGGDFNLEDEKGHVVVLDFWATWCGPCVKSLPGLIDAVAAFPADRVKLIGVNQGEAAAQVTRFLQTRGLKLAVALDADQSVGQKYGADSIPQTVIIAPDGKVAWVQTGASEDEDTSVSDTVKKLLDATSAANTLPDKSAQ